MSKETHPSPSSKSWIDSIREAVSSFFSKITQAGNYFYDLFFRKTPPESVPVPPPEVSPVSPPSPSATPLTAEVKKMDEQVDGLRFILQRVSDDFTRLRGNISEQSDIGKKIRQARKLLNEDYPQARTQYQEAQRVLSEAAVLLEELVAKYEYSERSKHLAAVAVAPLPKNKM